MARNNGSPKEYRPIFDHVRSLGWTVEIGGKHWSLRSPSGARVVVSISPRDATNAVRAIRRDLRRLGVEVPA